MPEETVRLKFTAGITYRKKSYGPGFTEEADVDPVWAQRFIEQGCAVPVKPVIPETVESLKKLGKAKLVARAEKLGIKTVPDSMDNEDIAKLILEKESAEKE